MTKGETYFMAGNTSTGCGHVHRTATAAKRCLHSMRMFASMTGGRRDSVRVHRVQFAVRKHSCATMGCPK